MGQARATKETLAMVMESIVEGRTALLFDGRLPELVIRVRAGGYEGQLRVSWSDGRKRKARAEEADRKDTGGAQEEGPPSEPEKSEIGG